MTYLPEEVGSLAILYQYLLFYNLNEGMVWSLETSKWWDPGYLYVSLFLVEERDPEDDHPQLQLSASLFHL